MISFFQSIHTMVELEKKQHINTHTQVINYIEKYFLIVYQKFEQLGPQPT